MFRGVLLRDRKVWNAAVVAHLHLVDGEPDGLPAHTHVVGDDVRQERLLLTDVGVLDTQRAKVIIHLTQRGASRATSRATVSLCSLRLLGSHRI